MFVSSIHLFDSAVLQLSDMLCCLLLRIQTLLNMENSFEIDQDWPRPSMYGGATGGMILGRMVVT